MNVVFVVFLIIGVQYCMNVVFVVLLIKGVQYCMNFVFVVLLIIGVQYCMNVVFVVLLKPFENWLNGPLYRFFKLIINQKWSLLQETFCMRSM